MNWRSSNENFKKESLKKVNEFLTELKSINKIKIKNIKDEQAQNSFDKIKDEIYKGIEDIELNIENILKKAEWSKLNIALFGETNAGKSTLLEVLSNGNGDTIGDGQKDYTRTVFTHEDETINIIDMPGIEGNTSIVINEIREAVNKSHVIFYVVGTNKEPEELTIKKIKELLHSNTKVYTIINLRGRVSQYKHKLSKGDTELIDINTKIVEDRIKKKFRELLGNHYVDNISVQAYLALLTNSKLNKEIFNSDKLKALEIFTTTDKLIKFSRINEMKNTILELSSSFNDEIRISNIYKFLGLFDKIQNNISSEYEKFCKCIAELNTLTNQYLKDVEITIKKYKGIIENENNFYIKSLETELKKLLSASIENEYSEKKANALFDTIKEESLVKLNNEIETHMKQMQNEILEKLTQYEVRIDIGMKYFNFEDSLNFEELLNSLKVDFKYILKQIFDTGMTLVGVVTSFLVNPFLGIATFIFGGIRKLVDWFKNDKTKRQREAYKKGSEKIESQVKGIKLKIESNQNKIFEEIDHKIKVSLFKVNEELSKYLKMDEVLNLQLTKLLLKRNSLSHFLLKDLLSEDVEFSYVDLNLSKTLIIGCRLDLELKNYLEKLLRVEELFVKQSLDEWINDIDMYTNNSKFYNDTIDIIKKEEKLKRNSRGEIIHYVTN